MLLITLFVIINSASAAIISFTETTDGISFKLDKGLMKLRFAKAIL
jgi:hypothetical protein